MKLADTLAQIHVATPCHADWNQMDGDERSRFCGRCRKHVYDLSALTAQAAAQLVREKEGRLCVQFYRRADGTMLHGEDCPVGLAARQWRRVKNLASAAASLVLLLLGAGKTLAADPGADKKLPPDAVQTRGEMCIVPPPTPKPTPAPTATPKPTATP